MSSHAAHEMGTGMLSSCRPNSLRVLLLAVQKSCRQAASLSSGSSGRVLSHYNLQQRSQFPLLAPHALIACVVHRWAEEHTSLPCPSYFRELVFSLQCQLLHTSSCVQAHQPALILSQSFRALCSCLGGPYMKHLHPVSCSDISPPQSHLCQSTSAPLCAPLLRYIEAEMHHASVLRYLPAITKPSPCSMCF